MDFTSPTIGRQGLYPPGMDCEWVFKPPIGSKGTLLFDNFDLETSQDCRKDYVEIRVGRKDTSPLYGRYCGSEIPRVITIEDDIYMKFHSNGNEQRHGFEGHYRIGDCVGHYTALEGRFTTTNFPGQLPTVYCEWRIIVPKQYWIRLVFKTFYIDEDHRGYCWDKGYYSPNYGMVIVRNGLERDDSKTLGRYCGNYAPTILSRGNTLLITLDKQESSWTEPRHVGIEAVYYAEAPSCEYRINIGQPAPDYGTRYQYSGNITSRNDTSAFPLSDGCVWVINARRDHIKLQFPEFDVGDAECKNEYVEVRDGDSDSSPLIGRFCRDNPPFRVIVSTHKQLFLKMKTSNTTNQDTGFFATYEEGKYRYYNGTKGRIRERRMEVEWKAFIEVPRGFLVYLEFPIFSMATLSVSDHFIVYDGPGYTPTGFLGSYSATFAPPILSRSNVVYINYKKYWTSEGIGADIKYKAVEPSCTSILRAGSGFITSDDVLTQLKEYPMCEWRVYSYTDPVVIIDFIDFDLVPSENCEKEYIEISGTYLNTSIEKRYCGNKRPKMIIVENAFIKFRPHSLNSLSRFNMSYRGACEFIFDGGNTGIIRIPTPESQRHFSSECFYKVSVDPGNRISLNFTKFNVTRTYHRLRPRIEVLDLPSQDVVAEVPAESIPSIIVSNSNTINIIVRVYDLQSEIDIHYSAEPVETIRTCASASGILFTDFDGQLSSPLHPEVYPPNQNCIWHIETRPDMTHLSPVLTFEDFDVGSLGDDGQNCRESDDFVEVYDGPSTSFRLLGRYCGSEVTGEYVVSRGNTLTVLFHSGEKGGGRGFSARYRAECYKVYEEAKGDIRLGYGNTWRTSLCTYEVRIPGGKGAVFDFTNVGIGYYEHLGVDQPHKLEIKVGKQKDFVGKIWHDYAPVLMVPDDVIYLEHHTTHRHSFFNVSYYQADVSCKKAIGNIELRETDEAEYPGIVKRIAIPEKCQWGLVNHCGGQIKVGFTHSYGSFYKRWYGNEPLCRDYVEARNGLSATADVTKKMCRNFVSWNYYGISTSSSVAVEFVAGGDRRFTYFETQYDAYCGGWSGGDKYLNEILDESWDNYNVTSLEAPWIAMFWDMNANVSFCSGVLVSNRIVLTSQTCMTEAGQRATGGGWGGIIVRLGKTESDKVEEHEQNFTINHYMSAPDHGVRIVKLDGKVSFNRHIAPICLPSEKVLESVRASEDTYGFTFGWAQLTQSGNQQTQLLRIPMQIKAWKACQNHVDDDYPYRKNYFCAGHVDGDDGGDRCYGHDGGPFLKIWKGRWYLYGIVANDWETWGNKGCPQRGKFGWFWRTVKDQESIYSIMCSYSPVLNKHEEENL